MMDALSRGATNEEATWMRLESGEDYVDYGEARALPFIALPHNERYELDFHRPFIDAVEYHCSCELGTMRRIPDVFDCWFESGSMPFAQFHYMGDETTSEGKMFVKNFPQILSPRRRIKHVAGLHDAYPFGCALDRSECHYHETFLPRMGKRCPRS
jgi:hypothetical protein